MAYELYEFVPTISVNAHDSERLEISVLEVNYECQADIGRLEVSLGLVIIFSSDEPFGFDFNDYLSLNEKIYTVASPRNEILTVIIYTRKFQPLFDRVCLLSLSAVASKGIMHVEENSVQ